jgi:hypothetical protein
MFDYAEDLNTMKSRCNAVVVGLLFLGTVSLPAGAQVPFDFSAAMNVRHKVESLCDTREGEFELKRMVSAVDELSGNKAPPQSPTYRTRLVRTGWTGTCIEGKLDGVGSLTTESRAESGNPIFDKLVVQQKTGLMIKGVQVGPWRIDKHSLLEELVGIYLIPGLPGAIPYYIRQNDGSFRAAQYEFSAQRGRFMVPIESTAPVSAAQVEQSILEFRQKLATGDSGSTMAAAKPSTVTIESTLLQDLMGGAKARFAANREIGDTHGKSLLVVFSNTTQTSSEHMDDFRNVVSSWGSQQTDAGVRASAANVVSMVDKKAFFDGLAAKLRQNFAKVTVENDLSPMTNGDADFALVFDFAFDHRVKDILAGQIVDASKTWDEIDRAYKTPEEKLYTAPAIYLGVSYFLLNKQLEVVRMSTLNPQAVRFNRAKQSGSYNDPVAKKMADGLAEAVNWSAVGLSMRLNHAPYITFMGNRIENSANILGPLLADIARQK